LEAVYRLLEAMGQLSSFELVQNPKTRHREGDGSYSSLGSIMGLSSSAKSINHLRVINISQEESSSVNLDCSIFKALKILSLELPSMGAQLALSDLQRPLSVEVFHIHSYWYTRISENQFTEESYLRAIFEVDGFPAMKEIVVPSRPFRLYHPETTNERALKRWRDSRDRLATEEVTGRVKLTVAEPGTILSS